MKLKDPVVYQIYPRSFQDSNGDGIGDLRGITSRLDHLQRLGVDAIWMSPIFSSPMKDFGYDVSNYRDIAPEYGTLQDLDDLIKESHDRGIAVLLDVILQHTSIEHPWFKENPDYYIRAARPLNNWNSIFGGSQWSKDPHGDGYYMHRFYPEQPDLDWRNPKVREEMYAVLQFWIDRGVDGFRLDAVDGMYRREDMADMPPKGDSPQLPFDPPETDGQYRIGYDSDLPETRAEMQRISDTFPEAWFVGEVALPTSLTKPYAEALDTAFNFEFLQSPLDAEHIANVLRQSPEGMAWVLSNHDFSRLVSRWGSALSRVAATMLLTLPGSAFIYQGDEIGMTDGTNEDTHDRSGRDKFRTPMQWTKTGGFSTVTPWLPYANPEVCNVEDEEQRTNSMLRLYEELIVVRKQLNGPLTKVEVRDGLLVFERETHAIACNLSAEVKQWEHGEVVFSTAADPMPGEISPRSATIAKQA